MTGRHVVFGTGALGSAVAESLLERNRDVLLVNRSGRNPLGSDVPVMAGDAADQDFATTAAQGAEAVYQCLNPPYTQWPELFPPLQQSIMSAAMNAGAKYVSLENVYMYGDTRGIPMTEDLPHRAHTRKGKVRAQMAEELMAANDAGRLRVATGRASDYFGPRAEMQSYFGSRVIPAALAGKRASVYGDIDQPHTWTYSADVGNALAILGTNDEADGEIWHVPSPPPRTAREMLTMIFETAGTTPKMQTAPKLLFRVMGMFQPVVKELVEMWYEFDQPFVVDSSKFSRKFGVAPTPTEEAIRTTVDWYRTRGT